jgi:TnpA family transposase
MGKIGADLALRFLGSAAQGDPAYRAAEHLGRLLRSIFLCGYVTIEDLHREIHTLLAGARRFINCRGLSTQANCAPSADGGAMR